MVDITYSKQFEKNIKKIKDKNALKKILKQIKKIANNHEIGKPMKYGRFGTRELYISPFRLSYIYNKNNDEILILSFYHKDKQ